VRTVSGESTSRSAICAPLSPSASWLRISRSRRVSGGRPPAEDGGVSGELFVSLAVLISVPWNVVSAV
jgi:hypothetical protein